MPGHLSEAIETFRQSIAVARVNFPPKAVGLECDQFGGFLQENGRLSEALVQYREAVRLYPDNSEVHDDLGCVLAREGKASEAISEYQEAIRLSPDNAKAHNDLGYAYSKLPDRLDDAMAEYRAAVDADPNFIRALDNLGNAYDAILRQYPQAQAEYEEALRIAPHDRMTHENLGFLKANVLSDFDGAVREYSSVTDAFPQDPAAHATLAGVLATAGRFPEAAAEYGKAAQFAPRSAEIQYDLGLVLLKISRRSGEAKAHFEAAERLRPDWPPPRQMLAQLPPSAN
jgi:tetratricopeptide (TPR) repeat protein